VTQRFEGRDGTSSWCHIRGKKTYVSEPYRQPFSVREVERPLEEAELEMVRSRRREELQRRRKDAQFHVLWALGGGVVALGLMIAGVVQDDAALRMVGSFVGVLFSVIGLAGYRDARRRQRAKPSRWLRDESAWSVRETRIVARSMVGAASDDEDYALWVLCEIPGEPWAFFRHVYEMPSVGEMARAELVLVTLLPIGIVLRAETDGDPIPLSGMRRDDPDAYMAACEKAQTWSPYDVDEDIAFTADDPAGRIDAWALPDWVLDATKH
jgi:hypothetical protein